MSGSDDSKAEPLSGDEPWRHRLRWMSRRGFAWAGAGALAGWGSWHWLTTRSLEGGLPWPLRRVLEFNERVAHATYRADRLAPSFSRNLARVPRVNGTIGLETRLDPRSWRLRVEGAAQSEPALSLTLARVQALPRVEMTTELKCIEGWSTVVHWAGARLSDLAAGTGLASRSGRREGAADLVDYVALETPDGEYYVGLDIASALHPQTLLCYEMEGAPLTSDHGAPLRLVIPTKYGIKSLKRIGTIRFTDVRPPDFWAERDYDWYAGH
jgi:DMSO/TMAO reductase YedYZ molybdopterin-dependent catalytic subunit